MKLLTKTYNIHAGIERVYYCFSDIDYILKEINRLKDNDELNVVKRDDELIFIGKTDLFSLKESESNKPKFYKSKITPISDALMRFGTATVTCEFSENGNNTRVIVDITSSKTPGFIWRIFIKIIIFILKFQSRADEKRYIKAIEQSA
ncbi:MAG: hypothetical protein AB2792_13375 [Candidatus Thiodiazotropha sp.]